MKILFKLTLIILLLTLLSSLVTVLAMDYEMIVLKENDYRAFIDDREYIISESMTTHCPKTIDGQVYIPIRFFSEMLGAVVKWNANDNATTITYNEKSFITYNTKDLIKLDNGQIYPCKMFILGGRLYIPLVDYCTILLQKNVFMYDEVIIISNSTVPEEKYQNKFIYNDYIAFYDNAASAYGFMDKNGQVVIEPIYMEAYDFSEGVAAVQNKNTGSWIFINEKNEEVLKWEYAYAYTDSFSDGLAAVAKVITSDEFVIKWGYIDHAGNQIVDAFYDRTYSFSCGYGRVYSETEQAYFFVDVFGNLLPGAKFTNANDFSEDLASVEIEGLYGYISKDGTLKIPNIYRQASDFHKGLALVRDQDDLSFFIDIYGNRVT